MLISANIDIHLKVSTRFWLYIYCNPCLLMSLIDSVDETHQSNSAK